MKTNRDRSKACMVGRKRLHAILRPDLNFSILTMVKLEQMGAKNVYVSSAAHNNNIWCNKEGQSVDKLRRQSKVYALGQLGSPQMRRLTYGCVMGPQSTPPFPHFG